MPLLASQGGAADSLGLEVDGQQALDGQRLEDLLDLDVRLAILIVELHVVHVGKLRLAHESVALRALVLLGGAGKDGQNVGLAILFGEKKFKSQ